IKFIHDGKIGDVKLAKGLCYKRRPSIGKVSGDTQPPKTMDYDLWTGPAELIKPHRKNVHYDWHWIWDTGNGDIGNQGIHEMDKARWGLNRGLPKHVVSTGGKFVYQDDQETPNTQIATLDYGDAQITFDVRGLITPGEGDVRRGNHFVGNIYFGSEGYMTV